MEIDAKDGFGDLTLPDAPHGWDVRPAPLSKSLKPVVLEIVLSF